MLQSLFSLVNNAKQAGRTLFKNGSFASCQLIFLANGNLKGGWLTALAGEMKRNDDASARPCERHHNVAIRMKIKAKGPKMTQKGEENVCKQWHGGKQ